MTTYEGGLRVPSMLRWPGAVKSSQIKTDIQSHQDMFISFAAVAGVPDVAEKMKAEKTQYSDGIDNVDYWTDKPPDSARTSMFYCIENKLTAVRMGPWRLHLSAKGVTTRRWCHASCRSCSTCAATRSRAMTARIRTVI
ncbi:MAG TPA: hypothetical protein VGD21_05750 [Lysobacter sp.]